MIRTLGTLYPPMAVHFWEAPVFVKGEYYSTCSCGAVSEPALSPRGARFTPCVFEVAQRQATARRIAFNRATEGR